MAAMVAEAVAALYIEFITRSPQEPYKLMVEQREQVGTAVQQAQQELPYQSLTLKGNIMPFDQTSLTLQCNTCLALAIQAEAVRRPAVVAEWQRLYGHGPNTHTPLTPIRPSFLHDLDTAEAHAELVPFKPCTELLVSSPQANVTEVRCPACRSLLLIHQEASRA